MIISRKLCDHREGKSAQTKLKFRVFISRDEKEKQKFKCNSSSGGGLQDLEERLIKIFALTLCGFKGRRKMERREKATLVFLIG